MWATAHMESISVMRSRRLSFVAGWVAVALLAIAGFAAFGTPEPDTDELMAEAAAASIGHTAGAYAGLTFALLDNTGDSTVLMATALETDPAGDRPEQAGSGRHAPDIARAGSASWGRPTMRAGTMTSERVMGRSLMTQMSRGSPSPRETRGLPARA